MRDSGTTRMACRGVVALAQVCADWPEGRDRKKQELERWAGAGYHFNLDWLLRSVNTVLTGEAKFQYLHDKSAQEIQEALKRSVKQIDTAFDISPLESSVFIRQDECLLILMGGLWI